MTLTWQEKMELTIFSQFASTCSLPIVTSLIEKRMPPEPDILCEVEGQGPVAFEMVQLIDESLAHRTFDQIKLMQAMRAYYECLPAMEKSKIQEKFGNALVHCSFENRSSFKSRNKAISVVMNHLQGMPTGFAGQEDVRGGNGHDSVVTRVTIQRGNFTGPCFDVDSGGSFSDPTLNAIRQKMEEKSYSTSAPIELLGYYELQPVLDDTVWLPEFSAYVRQKLEQSLFRRVWIFDAIGQTVKFVYPPLTFSPAY